jgi:hypothetical protein
MVRTASLFSQLLQEIPRIEFERLVKRHGAERGSKGYSCWNQLVSMLFCHLAKADSLREICNGLACCLGKLVHLGIDRTPNKSTLSYANAYRSADLYEDLLWTSLDHFRKQGHFAGSRHRFRFKNKLFSLDSTTISLCLGLFPWAKFRRVKGGVKLHVLLDHDDYMPAFADITPAKVNDQIVLKTLRLNPGSIVVADAAYSDFAVYSAWTEQGIHFVTRMKSNTVYEVVERRQVPQNRNILSDEVILLTGRRAPGRCPYPLRRIVVDDRENDRQIVLLTNHLDFGSTTISAIYKERWQIEIFFKALKQNLKIKTFIGTTENALRIQIWTALLALLLLKWLHYLSRSKWSFSNLVSLLRLNLFTYRNLWIWLTDPLGTPPLAPHAKQLTLPLNALGQLAPIPRG